MQIVATSLSTGVSLTLVGEAGGWRFDHWERSSDDRRLPPPPAHSSALTFATQGEAVSHFAALCAADPSARHRIRLERERDALVLVIGQPGVSPADRWDAARLKVEGNRPQAFGAGRRL